MIKSFLKAEFEDYKVLLAKIPSLTLSVLVLSVISMNLLANKELFHTSWIALDCGFVLSWIPFLLMDCLCKVFGGKAAAKISILSIFINLVVFGIFKLISLTPGMWGEYYASGRMEINEALNRTIGGSTWIVLGSALAMVVSSIVNSVVNMAIGRRMSGDGFGHFAARSLISTAISQFVDNLTFAFVVSVPLFGWNFRQVLLCSVSAAAFELLMEILFSGLGYRLAQKWSKG